MFQVNDYKIVFKKRWHHRTIDSLSHDIMYCDGRYDTVCEIYFQDKSMIGSGFKNVYNKEPSFTGVAILHPNDSVDRIVGKKIALGRSLMIAFPTNATFESLAFLDVKQEAGNKFQRKEIWTAFWQWVSQWPNQKKRQHISIPKVTVKGGVPNGLKPSGERRIVHVY